METTAATMADIITFVTTFFTALLGWIGDVAGLIMTTPLLQLGIAMMVCGAIWGYWRGLVRST